MLDHGLYRSRRYRSETAPYHVDQSVARPFLYRRDLLAFAVHEAAAAVRVFFFS